MKEIKNNEEKKQFSKTMLTDDYILWLSNIMNKYNNIDDIYFIHNNRFILNEKDLLMINYLKYFFKELNKFVIKKNMNYDDVFCYLLKYENSIYMIEYNGEGYSCQKHQENNYLESSLPCIEYKDLKKEFAKNMQFNFEFLETRIKDALNHTDLEKIRYELKKIQTPTLISGVGGSNVVSNFTTKVLRVKNGIITLNNEPRNIAYDSLNGFNNIIACSYSGNNHGVSLAFKNDLKKYLLSNNISNDPDVTYLQYKTTIPEEKSFISLAATLIPINILLNYYNNDDISKLESNIKKREFDFNADCEVFEIFSGSDTSTTSTYLESTITESGIGIPIVHDKYGYCHGRSTLSKNYNSIAIYLNRNTELDKLLLKEIKPYYKDIVIINSDETDSINADYQLLTQSMYLTKYIAEQKQKDLSNVEYSPITKVLYKYKGNV